MFKNTIFRRMTALVLTLALAAAAALPGLAVYPMPIRTASETEAVYRFNAATGKTIEQAEAEFADQGYGVFKPAVGEAVVELVRPIREKTEQMLGDKAYLESIYKEGAERASYLANKTLRKVYKKVGFVAR